MNAKKCLELMGLWEAEFQEKKRQRRLEPPTESQLELIQYMQEFSLPFFVGNSKADADEYINKYWDIAHECLLDMLKRH